MDRMGPVGVGIVMGAVASSRWSAAPEGWVALLCLALGLALALVNGRRDPSPGFLLAGLAIGGLAVATLPLGPRLRGPVSVVGVVSLVEGGRSAIVEASRTRPLGGDWSTTAGRLRVRFPDRAPPVGTPVLVFGMAGEPHHAAMPGSPGGWWTDDLARLRTTLQATLGAPLDTAPQPGPLRPMPGLLYALATGDVSQVEPELVQILRDTGTAHLLSVSGFHVGAVALIAGTIGHRLAALRALRDPVGVSIWPGRLAAVAASILFTIVVGAPVAAIRACLMACLVAFASATGRRVVSEAVLGAAAVAMVVPEPAVVATISFQLSFGALLGMITWGPVLDRYLPPDSPWWIDASARAGWVSVTATLGTLPGSAWWFQSLSISSPLANLLSMPLASFVLVPAAMLGTWMPGPIGDAAVWVGAYGVDLLELTLAPMAIEPLHPAVGPIGALGLYAVLATARHPSLGMAILLVTLGLRARPCDRTVITFLDVGQGDAIVVQHGDGRVDLVDAGTAWSGTATWLRREGLYRIDQLVLTHPDRDHAGGTVEILRSLRVGALLTPHLDAEEPPRLAAEAAGVPIDTGTSWRLWPFEPISEADNATSAVVQVETAVGSVLLTGDIDREVEQILSPLLGPVDVLKLAHHGSASSTSAELLEAIRPRLAVAQVGWNNRYGHPSPWVRRRLAEAGAPLLRTDLHGTVQVALDPTGVRVRTWRPRIGWSAWAPLPPRTVAPAA
jgi:competence protein ComEC